MSIESKVMSLWAILPGFKTLGQLHITIVATRSNFHLSFHRSPNKDSVCPEVIEFSKLLTPSTSYLHQFRAQNKANAKNTRVVYEPIFTKELAHCMKIFSTWCKLLLASYLFHYIAMYLSIYVMFKNMHSNFQRTSVHMCLQICSSDSFTGNL